MALYGHSLDFVITFLILLVNINPGLLLEIGVISQIKRGTELMMSSTSGRSGSIHWINKENGSLFDTVALRFRDTLDVLVTLNPMKRPPIDAIIVDASMETCVPAHAVDPRVPLNCAFHQTDQANHLLYTSHVIQNLNWSFVIILTDSDNSDEAHYLTNDLSRYGVKSNTFFMAEGEDNLSFLLPMINTSGTINIQPLLRFVMVCTPPHAAQIFTEAEMFDSRIGKRSLLRHFSRWLVILPHASITYIESMNLNLDHVTVVATPEGLVDLNQLKQSITTITLETLSSENISNQSQADLFLKLVETQTGLVQLSLHTLLWKTEGRRFSVVKMTESEDFCSQIFPNTKLGLNNRQLIGAVLEWKPFTMRHELNGSVYYTHASIDMLTFLAEVLNFTTGVGGSRVSPSSGSYHVRSVVNLCQGKNDMSNMPSSFKLEEPADNEWGRANPNDTTKYTGLLGMLQNGEIDLVPCPLGITLERETVADFLPPIYQAYNGIILRKSQTTVHISSALTDPFRWEVYALGGVALVSVTVLYLIFERLNPFYHDERSKVNEFKPAGTIDSIMFFFGAAIHQGSAHLPQSWSGRTLVSFWWLYSIVMTAAYSGNLIASLTVNEEKMPFSTLQELIASNDVKLGLWEGTVLQTTLQSSTSDVLKKLNEKINDSASKDPTVLSTKPSEHINKVKSENYGYLSDLTELESFEASMCDVYVLEEHFLPNGYSLSFQEGSPLTEMFYQEILKVQESGLLQFWMRKWSPLKNPSACPAAKTGAQPIELEKLTAVALAILAGILCSGASLIIEVALKSSATLLPK